MCDWHLKTFNPDDLKVVSTTFLLVCFLSLNKSTCQLSKLGKMFLISLQKLILFSRKSNFSIKTRIGIKQEIHFTE